MNFRESAVSRIAYTHLLERCNAFRWDEKAGKGHLPDTDDRRARRLLQGRERRGIVFILKKALTSREEIRAFWLFAY